MRKGNALTTTPEEITAEVLRSMADTPDARLGELLSALTRHLHAFAVETALTEEEWAAGIRFLTEAGQTCTPTRQELVLLSDTLGLSMVVDAVNHGHDGGVTESTVLGPFHVDGAPRRPLGSSIVDQPGSGDPACVSGRVLDPDGRPIAGAELDVWQNNAEGRYAAQDATQPRSNLRGRFTTGPDGHFDFWAVRPTDYCIPDDGPVGSMLQRSGRHPWRPAHLHMIVSADGYQPLTTHFFDAESPYLESDAVFGVKPSLVSAFEPHGPDEPGAPGAPGDGVWYRLRRDVVLAPTG